MKKRILSFLLIVIIPLSFLYPQHKEITLEKIFMKPEFYPEGAGTFRSMNDGIHYVKLDESFSINVYEYATGNKVKTLINGEDFVSAMPTQKISVREYTLSPDETKILITTDREQLYRRSSLSNYYVWDISASKLLPLTKSGKAMVAEFSPDGSKVAMVRENNIYIVDLSDGSETAVTTDGEINKVINGKSDWVYEEELNINKAFEWSPDGSKIAYLRFDESCVKMFDLIFYGTTYPENRAFKYPKAGEDNSIVTINIYDLATGKTIKIDTGDDTDRYIPRIYWTGEENMLAFVRLNRLQNKIEILRSDVSENQASMENGMDSSVVGSSVIFSEQSDTYISEESVDLEFLSDYGFLFTSDSDGYKHIYRYDKNGNRIAQLTKGNYDISDIKGIDNEKGTVYYTAHEQSPLQKDVFAVNIDGTGKRKLSLKNGSSDIRFSTGFKYYILSYSSTVTPPVYSLHRPDGTLVRVIEDNKEYEEKIKEYGFSKKELFSFKTSEGVELFGYIVKPRDFNPKKKYPLLMYVYGGPGSKSVSDSWGSFDFYYDQYLASKGYVTACVDGRCTGGRGRDFEKQVYRQMGKLETTDQIEAAKYFSTLEYIDKNRIGIWGWSHGGYMSALCMTVGADYFSTGVSIAPVINFRYYDNIFSERFLGLPQDNPGGYDMNSPITYAENLKGKLLIVHGSADDNVHMQNTMEFVKALVSSNKQFEMQIYPDKNHNITGGYTRYHLFVRVTDFILRNL